jgi:energy-coupling factor transport system ATP-binding protein
VTLPEATAATRPPTEAVRLESVGFVYSDGTRALQDVSLSIASGERVVIAGENGSGKSTLVRQLNGLLRPTEGRVVLFGQDTRQRHVAELARVVGLAFQNPDRQIFAGSVRAEVAFGPRNLGRSDVEVDRLLRGIAVGLADESGPTHTISAIRDGVACAVAAGYPGRHRRATTGRRPGTDGSEL